MLSGYVGLVMVGFLSIYGNHRAGAGVPAMWICGLGIAAGLPAVICGHLAFRSLRRAPSLGAMGRGAIGLCLGYTCLLFAFASGLNIPKEIARQERQERDSCRANLRVIQSAKATWALERHKSSTDLPSQLELFGPGNFLPDEPHCPAGGTYILNPVSRWPCCTQHSTSQ